MRVKRWAKCCREQKESSKSGIIIESVMGKLLRMGHLGLTSGKSQHLSQSSDRMCTIGVLGRQLELTSTMALTSSHSRKFSCLSCFTHTHTHTHTYIPIHLKQQFTVPLLPFSLPLLRKESAASNTINGRQTGRRNHILCYKSIRVFN